jgi:hypothetical protein
VPEKVIIINVESLNLGSRFIKQSIDGAIVILLYLTARHFSTPSMIFHSGPTSINLSILAEPDRENAGCSS